MCRKGIMDLIQGVFMFVYVTCHMNSSQTHIQHSSRSIFEVLCPRHIPVRTMPAHDFDFDALLSQAASSGAHAVGGRPKAKYSRANDDDRSVKEDDERLFRELAISEAKLTLMNAQIIREMKAVTHQSVLIKEESVLNISLDKISDAYDEKTYKKKGHGEGPCDHWLWVGLLKVASEEMKTILGEPYALKFPERAKAFSEHLGVVVDKTLGAGHLNRAVQTCTLKSCWREGYRKLEYSVKPFPEMMLVHNCLVDYLDASPNAEVKSGRVPSSSCEDELQGLLTRAKNSTGFGKGKGKGKGEARTRDMDE